jgi:hypothetical protein
MDELGAMKPIEETITFIEFMDVNAKSSLLKIDPFFEKNISKRLKMVEKICF